MPTIGGTGFGFPEQKKTKKFKPVQQAGYINSATPPVNASQQIGQGAAAAVGAGQMSFDDFFKFADEINSGDQTRQQQALTGQTDPIQQALGPQEPTFDQLFGGLRLPGSQFRALRSAFESGGEAGARNYLQGLNTPAPPPPPPPQAAQPPPPTPRVETPTATGVAGVSGETQAAADVAQQFGRNDADVRNSQKDLLQQILAESESKASDAVSQLAAPDFSPTALETGLEEMFLNRLAQGDGARDVGLGQVGSALEAALLGRLNQTGEDPIAAAQRARFERGLGNQREQTIADLNRFGVIGDVAGGAAADVMGEFDALGQLGLLDIDAEAQRRRDADLGRAQNFAQFQSGLGLQNRALGQQDLNQMLGFQDRQSNLRQRQGEFEFGANLQRLQAEQDIADRLLGRRMPLTAPTGDEQFQESIRQADRAFGEAQRQFDDTMGFNENVQLGRFGDDLTLGGMEQDRANRQFDERDPLSIALAASEAGINIPGLDRLLGDSIREMLGIGARNPTGGDDTGDGGTDTTTGGDNTFRPVDQAGYVNNADFEITEDILDILRNPDESRFGLQPAESEALQILLDPDNSRFLQFDDYGQNALDNRLRSIALGADDSRFDILRGAQTYGDGNNDTGIPVDLNPFEEALQNPGGTENSERDPIFELAELLPLVESGRMTLEEALAIVGDNTTGRL